MFENRPHTVLKKLSSTKAYALYVSTSKEINELSRGLLKPEDDIEVMAYGVAKDMDLITAENVIPSKVFIRNVITNKTEDVYKCWCCKAKGIEQFVGHKTVLNSWECLLVSLGNPTYVIIVRKTIEENADN